jgi:glutathione S-transferase
MVLIKKGVFYVAKNVLPDTVPDFLLSAMPADRLNVPFPLPCLHHQNQTYISPMVIAEHIDKHYPHKSLTKVGMYSYQEILDKTAQFYPKIKECMAAFEDQNIKTRHDISSHNQQLLGTILSELEKLDQFLRTTPGHYFGGLDMTLADLYITPLLFRTVVAVEHFFKYPVLRVYSALTREQQTMFPALETYMTHMFNKEVFKDSRVYCDVDKVIHGWKAHMVAKSNTGFKPDELLPAT